MISEISLLAVKQHEKLDIEEHGDMLYGNIIEDAK